MNCWDCAHLGRCQHASKRVKSCKYFKDYTYAERFVTNKEVAKILGISVRTLLRRMNKSRAKVLMALKERGRQFSIVTEICKDRSIRRFYEVEE